MTLLRNRHYTDGATRSRFLQKHFSATSGHNVNTVCFISLRLIMSTEAHFSPSLCEGVLKSTGHVLQVRCGAVDSAGVLVSPLTLRHYRSLRPTLPPNSSSVSPSSVTHITALKTTVNDNHI